jgi:hypothetical protein
MAAATSQLMDTDSASLLGSYPSEQDALHAVAAAAKRHGRDSEAVVNLVLFRQDGAERDAFIAEGTQLVERALAAADAEGGETPTNGRAAKEHAARKAVGR